MISWFTRALGGIQRHIGLSAIASQRDDSATMIIVISEYEVDSNTDQCEKGWDCARNSTHSGLNMNMACASGESITRLDMTGPRNINEFGHSDASNAVNFIGSGRLRWLELSPVGHRHTST